MPNVTSTIPRGRRRYGSQDALQDFLTEGSAQLTNVKEDVRTSASPVTGNQGIYETDIITGGTAGTEAYNLGVGTVVGQRKLIKLKTRTHASDVLSLDHANILNNAEVQATNVDLDAANEFVMVEWTGTKWKIIYANATIAP